MTHHQPRRSAPSTWLLALPCCAALGACDGDGGEADTDTDADTDADTDTDTDTDATATVRDDVLAALREP